jgi:hypothetical protein
MLQHSLRWFLCIFQVLEKCVCLHQVNQTVIRNLEDHLQQV